MKIKTQNLQSSRCGNSLTKALIIVLFCFFTIPSGIVVSSTIPDSVFGKDQINLQNHVIVKNSPDTIKTEFKNDTVKIEEPIPIGTVIYTEHKTEFNTLLEYVFPIFMLFFGVFIDRCILKHEERKRLKGEGLRWKSELNSLITPIQQQQEAFKKFIHKYCDAKNRFDIPTLSSLVLLKCEIFDSLNKENLYEFLQSKLKNDDIATKEYHKIIQVISSLKSCQQNLSNVIAEMRSHSSKLIDHFNQSTQDYSRKLIMCLDSNLLPPTEGTKLQNLYLEFNKQMPYINIFKLEDSFIRPSIEILDLSKCKSQGRLELYFCLCSMLDAIRGLRNEKLYIKQNLEQLSQTYGRISTTICSIKFDE